jgi:imidazolonepropionase-like amidohydrolase
VIQAGAVVIMDGIIRETGPFDAIAPKYPGADILGDGTQLLLPGLVDAHSHGRGQELEPDIDPATIGDAPVAFFPEEGWLDPVGLRACHAVRRAASP